MAKKKQHIDDFFKENLAHKDLPLDGTEWSRLEHALAPKRKRRFMWWWLLLPLALFGLWALFNPSSNQEVDAETIVDRNEYNKDNTNNHNADNSEITASEERDTEESTLTPFEREHGTNVIRIVEETEATEHSSNEQATSTIHSNGVEPIAIDVDPVKIVDYSHLLVEIFSKTALILDYNATFKSLDSSDLKSVPSQTSKMKPISVSLPWHIGVNVGGNINQQRMNSNKDELITYRTLNEKQSFRPEVQVDLKTEFKGFSYSAGLGYVSTQQSLGKAYSNNPEIRVLLYDSIAFVDINDDTTWLPWNYRDSVIKTGINNPSYNYMSIPISVGKAFNLGPRSSVELIFNLRPQYLLSASGQVAGPSLRVYDVSTAGINRFNLRTGLEVAYNYQLMPRWQLQTKAGMQYDLIDMSKNDEITQHIDLYGLKLGLYYRLK
ncbi:MAG: hypothetical protein JXR19_11455 [Bacteroidia bacterium]